MAALLAGKHPYSQNPRWAHVLSEKEGRDKRI